MWTRCTAVKCSEMEELQRRRWEWISLRIDQTDSLMYIRRMPAEGEIKVERQACERSNAAWAPPGAWRDDSLFRFRLRPFCLWRHRISIRWSAIKREAGCIHCALEHTARRTGTLWCWRRLDISAAVDALPVRLALMEDTSRSTRGSSASRTSRLTAVESPRRAQSPDQVPPLMYVD